MTRPLPEQAVDMNVPVEIWDHVVHAADEIGRQVASLPDMQPHNLWVIPVALGAAAVSILRDAKGASARREKAGVPFKGVNKPALRKSIIDTETRSPVTEKVLSRKHRLLPRALMATGFAITAAAAITDPTIITSGGDSDTTPVAAVVGASFSDIYTSIGSHTSRLQGEVEGLESSAYDNDLGVVVDDGNASTAFPLGPKSNTAIGRLISTSSIGSYESSDTNADGEFYIVPAMQAAAKLLPFKSGTNDTERTGEIDILDDGIVNDSSSAIQNEFNSLKKQGIEVKAVLAGNAKHATYSINSQQSRNSTLQPNTFTSFGNKNVITASTSELVAKAIESAEDKDKARDLHHETDVIPLLIGAGTIFVGYRKYGRKLRNVTV
jgi:hypothetical protein